MSCLYADLIKEMRSRIKWEKGVSDKFVSLKVGYCFAPPHPPILNTPLIVTDSNYCFEKTFVVSITIQRSLVSFKILRSYNNGKSVYLYIIVVYVVHKNDFTRTDKLFLTNF